MRGLRPYERAPRDSAFLIECKGGIGRAGTFMTLPPLDLTIPVTFTTGGFPYPQIFVFIGHILIACQTEILEWDAPFAVSKISSLPIGSPWAAVEYNDYLYLSNGVVAVSRNTLDGTYQIDHSLLAAEALLDAHGQVMIGGISAFGGNGEFGLGTFGEEPFGG